MEREIFLTGIGGQGVQLAARVLALAATGEGRNVMSLGTYGGTMRGGNTDSTVVVADSPIVSPPIVSRGWAAVVAHDRFWEPMRAKLRPGSVVVFDEGLVAAESLELEDGRFMGVAAGTLAREAGAAMAASLVLVAAFCGATHLVGLDALVAAMEESVPSYRRQHVAGNAAALRAGYTALPARCAPAWAERESAA
jgi:Pyruvate/2-oxoacid:ferredoxin oxidoreductase gamma subunit